MSVFDQLGINEDAGIDPRTVEKIKLKLKQVEIAAAQATKTPDADAALAVVSVALLATTLISQMKPWEAAAFGQQLEAYATGQQALSSGVPRPVSPPAVPQAPQQEPQPQNLHPDFLQFLEDLQLDLGLPAIQVKTAQHLNQVLENVKSAAKTSAPSPASSGVDAKALKQELSAAVSKFDAAETEARKDTPSRAAKQAGSPYGKTGNSQHQKAVNDLLQEVKAAADKLKD